LLEHGFRVGASQTNFLLTEVPATSPCGAKQLYEALKTRGVLVRYFDTPALQNTLRITVGTPEQNQTLLTWVGDILSRGE
jgi:histidinol-phosphate aminotransferase